MDGGVKQRLVGALVLISLAVIFLPMIFEKPGEIGKREIIVIPSPPEKPVVNFQPVEVPVPQFPDEVEETAEVIDGSPWLEDTDAASASPIEVPEVGGGSVEVGHGAPEDAPLVAATPEPQPETPADATGAVNGDQQSGQGSPEAAVEVKPLASSPVDEKQLPVAWSVQLGVFSKTANAEDLRNQLLKSGYKAYSREIRVNGNDLTRVLVGPTFNHSEAETWKGILDGRFNLESRVVRYEVSG